MERGNELLVVVPSRGRPHNLTRLLDGIASTMTGSADVLVAVDDDDPRKDDYLEAVQDVGFAWLEAGPRQGLGPTLNRHVAAYGPSYQAVGFMGDDHLPRTIAWDTLVLAALAELGTGWVYGDDKLQGAALPTAVFMTSCIPQALGWVTPPGLVHYYLDNAWLALGRRLGRIRYLPHVVIEHLHPVLRKAPMDATYREAQAAYEAKDEAAFRAWVMERLEGDTERVLQHCVKWGQGR
jgi:hypothetical protein